MNDLISIIVPVYNADEHFIPLLCSLFCQTYDDIEYIFVDDNSTNNCLRVLNDTMARFPRTSGSVRIIHHETNRGISSARKTGLAAATGEYVAFADQDDLLDYNMMYQMHLLISCHHSDIAICGYTSDTTSLAMDELANVETLSPRSCMRQSLIGYSCALLWNKLIRRQLFLDNDVDAPEGMTMLEDLHVLYRLFYYANSVVACSNPFYHWRANPSSASHLYQERITSQASVLIDAVKRMELFFKENSISDADLIDGMISQETRILIDLALYGDLSFLESNRSLFYRVNYKNVIHRSYFSWYAKLVALSFTSNFYSLLSLLRFMRAVKRRFSFRVGSLVYKG